MIYEYNVQVTGKLGVKVIPFY